MGFFRKFGKHYAIERFAVLFVLLFTAMFVLVTTIVTSKIKHDKQVQVNQTIYTTNFAFSLTDTKGTVEQIYTNQDRNRVFVLLHYDDVSSLSLTAEDYQTLITGCDVNLNDETLKTPDVKCGIYIFGISGYMGLYFENPEPFSGQLYNLTLRSYKKLYGTNDELNNVSNSQLSFAQYDQARIYFNPGGLNMPEAQFLNEGSHDAIEIYQQTILLKQEAKLRTTAYNDLKDMFSNLKLAQQYRERLENDFNVTFDSLPADIDGDEISAYSRENGDEIGWSTSSGWVDRDGNQYSEDDVLFALVTSHHVPGGYSFNFQNTRLSGHGYLKEVLGNQTAQQLFADHKKLLETAPKELNVDDVKFYYKDGREVDMKSAEVDAELTQVRSEITRLTNVWKQIYALKYKYETQDLYDLLYLEYNANNVTERYDVSWREDNVFVY